MPHPHTGECRLRRETLVTGASYEGPTVGSQNYAGVNVKNFTTSWSDGLAFNALLHRWRPQLFDYAGVVARPAGARLDHAFQLAHDHLGIDRLLDPEGAPPPLPLRPLPGRLQRA